MRHEYDPSGGSPGPRSATWFRELNHSFGIVTAVRDNRGNATPERPLNGRKFEEHHKGTNVLSAQSVRPGIRLDHLAGSGRSDTTSIEELLPFHGAATERSHICAQAISGPKDDPRAKAILHPKWASFKGQQGARRALVLEQGRDSPAFVLTDRSPVERTTSAKRPRWFNE